MMRISLLSALFAATIALPQSAASAATGASFQASLTIVESCHINSFGAQPLVACRHASAYRVDGATVTF